MIFTLMMVQVVQVMVLALLVVERCRRGCLMVVVRILIV